MPVFFVCHDEVREQRRTQSSCGSASPGSRTSSCPIAGRSGRKYILRISKLHTFFMKENSPPVISRSYRGRGGVVRCLGTGSPVSWCRTKMASMASGRRILKAPPGPGLMSLPRNVYHSAATPVAARSYI